MSKELDLRKIQNLGNSQYGLPNYKLTDSGLQESKEVATYISFVKGNKEGKNQNGVVTETVISMLIQHLTNLNVGDFKCKEDDMVITKLQEAMFWIEERKRDRIKRKVYGTQEA